FWGRSWAQAGKWRWTWSLDTQENGYDRICLIARHHARYLRASIKQRPTRTPAFFTLDSKKCLLATVSAFHGLFQLGVGNLHLGVGTGLFDQSKILIPDHKRPDLLLDQIKCWRLPDALV